MTKLIAPISIALLCLSFSTAPAPVAGNSKDLANFSISHFNVDNDGDLAAAALYNSIDLSEAGLSEQAFDYAYRGYQRLVKMKRICKCDFLTICDFSQSSRNKRFYLIDLGNNKLLLNTYVAHGRNSGGEFATRFSNKAESMESSLGFYITRNTYIGEHGLSLKIEGVDPGFNDKALRRNIVIHGADYIDDNWLRHTSTMGRSFGCPAVPQKESAYIINTIKNGNCLFIYHPSKNYLKGSKILNG